MVFLFNLVILGSMFIFTSASNLANSFWSFSIAIYFVEWNIPVQIPNTGTDAYPHAQPGEREIHLDTSRQSGATCNIFNTRSRSQWLK